MPSILRLERIGTLVGERSIKEGAAVQHINTFDDPQSSAVERVGAAVALRILFRDRDQGVIQKLQRYILEYHIDNKNKEVKYERKFAKMKDKIKDIEYKSIDGLENQIS